MGHAIRHTAQDQIGRVRRRYGSAVQLLVLTSLVGFAYGLATSPYFAVREVSVDAPDSGLAKQALANLHLPAGASTLLYPVQRLARGLERCPQIKRAVVERDLPGRLIVRVWRRQPVAAAQSDGQWALLDEEGICVDTTAQLPVSLIQCYGLTQGPPAVGQRLAPEELELLSATLSGLRGQPITRGLVMDFSDPYLIQIHSPTGVLGKLGTREDLERKLALFVAIMQQLEEKEARPAYIDVRIMQRPVWQPRPR